MEDLIHRPSARVLLVDERDRLLLFRDKAEGGRWFTPGGGIDPGESVVEAGVRELREETGLVVAAEDLGPVVATARGYWQGDWDGRMRWAVDSYFFHRAASFEPDTSGFTHYERDFIAEIRWWTQDELAADVEAVVPHGLQELLPPLLQGTATGGPVELPWHHPEFAHLTPPPS
ncbi:NUDIX hydrolase [Actinocorallia longicatena]|uniref:NUDIX hydrolase n=1 Tax=Actinocorallia longicatena TaxID=111803 RepID=A0ABP6QLX0_9ACTN